MEAIWKPVGNRWVGRGDEKVCAVCLHVAEGQRGSVFSWFSNSSSDASAHYLVNNDGTVWQFVSEEDTAWANGQVQRPDRSIGWLADCVDRGQNPNRLTIAIETERRWWEPLTVPQYQTLVALVRDILARHGLTASRETVIPHAAIDSVSRARCPGNIDWSRLFADLTTDDSETFLTGQRVRGPFLRYWRDHGGLPIFGYPLTGEQQDGDCRVQWFERARFELHPNGVILLGRVGAELLARQP